MLAAAEFDWVVGCSYRGLPETVSVVRNPIGAKMSLRTSLALEAGASTMRWDGWAPARGAAKRPNWPSG